jgi:tight adherence protein B
MELGVPTIIYVLAFIAVVLVVQALMGIAFSARERTQSINRRMTLLDSGMNPEDVYATLVRRSAAEGSGTGRAIKLERRFDAYCQQADLKMAPRRFLALLAAGTAALWLVSLVLLGAASGGSPVVNGATSLLGAVVLMGLGAWVWLGRRRTGRQKKIEEQLPLALDIINRAVRAGHPVISAVQLAAQEMGDPIGSEFGLIVDETTYGLEFREALTNFARRTGSRDAAFFAVSVGIQSQTGGNLAEILDGLATVIRGRSTLSKRVKALASEGKTSAMLLSAMPVLMIGFMLATQPSFYTSKVNDPIFWPVIAIVMVIYFIGLLMMRRIINFKY